MLFISDDAIDRLIAEDVPYMDLTTWLLGIGEKQGKIEYFTREPAVVCGTEEAVRVFEKLRIRPDIVLSSGTPVEPGQVLLSGSGSADSLHKAWKVCQNLLDHSSGIASKTRRLVSAAEAVNPDITVLTTRKSFPGTKALGLKAVMTGGALPHRLGLSETLLVFRQHMDFLGGFDAFLKMIPVLKKKCCEKKLIAEADDMERGVALCRAGIDGIQFDKLSAAELKKGVAVLRGINPDVILFAAGGITEENAAEYANTGVDALVTTNLFSARPTDIGTRMSVVE